MKKNWVYSVDYLIQKQGYTVDKKVEEELINNAKKALETKEFNFIVVK